MDKTIILEKLKSPMCINIFKNEQVTTVILFGSILRDDFAPYSDIDIAILCNNDIPFTVLAAMEESFQDIFKREIDIINLADENTELNLRVDIFDNGEIIYVDDNLELYNSNYNKVERIYKENETFRYFKERELIYNE